MDLFELMMKRRSVRNFEDRPVPPDVVDRLLDAANNAPSGGNIQPLSIVVVQESEARAELAEMVGRQPWVRNAPVSMVFCIDFFRVKRWASMFEVDFLGEQALRSFLIAYADVMCAAQNVVILAEDSGLGSVYVGTIQSSIGRAREFFGMPEYVLPVMVLSLGYPKSVPGNIPKLDRDVIAHRERYRTPADGETRDAFEAKYGNIDADVNVYLDRAYVEVVEADRQQDLGWVEDAKERMEKLGIKSNAEFLFNLRYPQRVMVGMNSRLIASLNKAGFDFAGLGPENRPGGEGLEVR
ncbi:MAG: nitroreductase family protein [Candidatus Eisenbacteria sp.]|nr:nitroreductase family protein [Candidatus Eisenbacteria bacterium]